MNTAISPVGAASAQSRMMQLALAAFLGFVIIGVSGFAPMEVVHNAAHDFRHSMAFPCH